MDVGILVSLPEHIERFEPVVGKLPGSDFVLSDGRWPSQWRDSRRMTTARLAATGRAWARRSRQFDVLVATNAVACSVVQERLRPRGRLVVWRDDPSVDDMLMGDVAVAGEDGGASVITSVQPPVVLSAGADWLPDPLDPWSCAVGDPAVDAASSAAARARARAFLGLTDPDRPCVLVYQRSYDGAVQHLAPALARLRADCDVMLRVHSRAWLGGSQPVARCFRGPGVSVVTTVPTRAELLAAADVVLAEPSLLLHQAIGHGIPAAGLGPGRDGFGLAWVDDRSQVDPTVRWLLARDEDYLQSTARHSRGITGPVDAGAAERVARQVRDLISAAEAS